MYLPLLNDVSVDETSMKSDTMIFQIKFILIVAILQVINSENPIVTTKVGSFRGIRAPDGDFDQFMGIPYANVQKENPFGNSVPQPVFEYIFDAFNDSAICPQIEEFNNTIVGSLDCLHLNIYVPTFLNSTNKLPVMVYIYGGSFNIGFGGRFLYGAKYLVRHDVILVSLNYRLGPYGFMCLDTPEVPGNQGLKDQVIALKWIRDNIESFGGDAERITVFGNSAGAISIDLHMHSQVERLFQKMILQSGSAVLPGLVRESDTSVPFKIAEQLGYTTNDLNEALAFLAAADPASVIEAGSIANVRFDPCKEKSFPDVVNIITDFPINLPIPKAEGVSIMLGVNNKEMLLLSSIPPEFLESGNFFGANLATMFLFESDVLNKLEYLVRRFYIGDKAMNQDVMLEIIDFMSDTSVVYHNNRNVKRYLENGVEKLFHYVFSYSGGRNFVKFRENITEDGASHADEIGYLFEMEFIPEVPSPEDQLVIDRMTKMWTNFAKYGDPTPTTSELLPVKWEGISRGSVYHYLNIDSQLSAGKRPFHQRMAFWDLFYKAYGEYLRDLKENDASSSVSLRPTLRVCIMIALPLITVLGPSYTRKLH